MAAGVLWFQEYRPRKYASNASWFTGRLPLNRTCSSGESLAWMASQATMLRPLWTVFHLAVLAWAFYKNDFSVLYVASNSNSALPKFYRITAVWGAHEGSLLLWALALATWSIAVGVFSRNLPETYAARVLGVLGIVSVGFQLFILLTSNPFERLLPAAADGRDLLAANAHGVAFSDAFPVSPGHTRIVSRRHIASLFDLRDDEQAAMWALVGVVK